MSSTNSIFSPSHWLSNVPSTSSTNHNNNNNNYNYSYLPLFISRSTTSSPLSSPISPKEKEDDPPPPISLSTILTTFPTYLKSKTHLRVITRLRKSSILLGIPLIYIIYLLILSTFLNTNESNTTITNSTNQQQQPIEESDSILLDKLSPIWKQSLQPRVPLSQADHLEIHLDKSPDVYNCDLHHDGAYIGIEPTQLCTKTNTRIPLLTYSELQFNKTDSYSYKWDKIEGLRNSKEQKIKERIQKERMDMEKRLREERERVKMQKEKEMQMELARLQKEKEKELERIGNYSLGGVLLEKEETTSVLMRRDSFVDGDQTILELSDEDVDIDVNDEGYVSEYESGDIDKTRKRTGLSRRSQPRYQQQMLQRRYSNQQDTTSNPASKNTTTTKNKLRKSIKPSDTKIECSTIETKVPERFCRSTNVALRVSKIPNRMKEGDHGLDLFPNGTGVLMGNCGLDEKTWFLDGQDGRNGSSPGKAFGVGGAGWFYRGIDFVEGSDEEIQCDAWIDKTLYGVSRWDTTNVYQAHQDFLNTFIVYSYYDLDHTQVQPILFDSRSTDGPYLAAWSHLFTTSKQLMDIRHLPTSNLVTMVDDDDDEVDEAMKKRRDNRDPPKTICIKDMVWGIHGGISPLSRGGGKITKCETKSPLLNAFRDYMIEHVRWAVLGSRLYNAHQSPSTSDTNLQQQKQDGGDAVVWAKESMIPMEIPLPVPGHLAIESESDVNDDLNSLLKMWGPQVQDESDTIAFDSLTNINNNTNTTALETLTRIRSNLLSKSNVAYEFRAVDFAKLSFEEQVGVATGTDLFVGPHGAVFAYLVYLRRWPKAGVLELKPPTRDAGNFQFWNLAKRMGHIYSSARIADQITELHFRNIERELTSVVTQVWKQRVDDGVEVGV
ncbi:hypothetical protein HDU76_000323 [Blyttiomyces sp. JEL0837]|nr:hypothetical protein HDU76_000323 [Blyttiomyces sp. JEL0837]